MGIKGDWPRRCCSAIHGRMVGWMDGKTVLSSGAGRIFGAWSE
jgi:hypothetical protein